MYSNILVPIDGSPTSDQGFREAVSIAKGLGATLHFVYVVDPRRLFAEVTPTTSPQQLLDDWRAAGERLVAQAIADASAAGVSAEAVVRCDFGRRVCDEILDEVRRTEADLVVMGTHGRSGIGRFVLGSDAEQVLRMSNVPVLTVRGPRSEGPASTCAGAGTAAPGG